MDSQTPPSSGESPDVSRRDALKVALGAGGALFVIFGIPTIAKQFPAGSEPDKTARVAAAKPFLPNAFVLIDPAGDVTFSMPQVEMGQGTYTSMSMLIAEELEIGLDQIKVAAAPPDDKAFGNPLLGFQVTGGSTSVRGFYKPLRVVGATVREILVAAAAKTWGVDPSSCHAEKGAVIHAATGRKLGYGDLTEAAATIPVPTDAKLKDPKDFKLIGTSAKRVDTVAKATGQATFGIDVRLPDMKIATIATCPIVGGTLATVDDSKAKAIKGVRQIIRLDDAVAVVADHMGAARKGLEALVIAWNGGENSGLSSGDIVSQLASASQQAGAVATKQGDVESALKGAARTVEATYELPFLAHAAMEPINCTVHVRKDGCDVWLGTQVITRVQKLAAEVTGLPLENIAVHNQYLGGGFGRRLETDSVAHAIEIGKQVDGPVKVVWTREQDIQHDVYRPYYYDRLRAGLDGNGKPVAFHHRVTGSSIIARWIPPFFKDNIDADAVEGATGVYDLPNTLVDYVRLEPPKGITTGWWRGVGITHNAFVVEGFIDELAASAGKDAVEYRRSLLASQPRARAVLDLAAEKAGWGSPLPKGSGRGIAVLFGFGTYMAQVAEVSVADDGKIKVERMVCAVDSGIVVNPDTVRAQIEGGIMFGLTAALYGEITFKDGRVEQSNFDTYPILRIDAAPSIEVHIVSSTEEPGGMGEPGTSATAPALVNAIHAATGKRLRKLPVDTRQIAKA
ncbi:aldehyde oxidase [Labrys miyagiensis]